VSVFLSSVVTEIFSFVVLDYFLFKSDFLFSEFVFGDADSFGEDTDFDGELLDGSFGFL